MLLPRERSRVAVVGPGGNLGSLIFGLLQRASSFYETGVSNNVSPRGITATAFGSGRLNQKIGSSFKLAVATEDKIALTNLLDVESIKRRLTNFDYVVTPIEWHLTQSRVTANTFGKGPNDMTTEAFFQAGEVDGDVADDDASDAIFFNVMKGGKHLIIVGTGNSEKDDGMIKKLKKWENVKFTFIKPLADKFLTDPIWTYEKGLRNLLVCREAIGEGGEDGVTGLSEGGNEMNVEDLAIFVVAAILSCDPKESRVLEVLDTGEICPTYKTETNMLKPPVSSKSWCVGQEYILSMLSAAIQAESK
ncbi:hypothetical protein TrLO_g14827 [Triparma laevis f. longispina]|nr:hypothetical protein TrLO_g14827 [Triparma laevis f. longispina]